VALQVINPKFGFFSDMNFVDLLLALLTSSAL